MCLDIKPNSELPAIMQILVGDKDITSLTVKQRIVVIENAMMQYERVDVPVKHSFADGLYMRQITIPAGTILTSKVHKHGQCDFMLTGDMSIVTDDGTIARVKAPFTSASGPGMKRLGYAYEDTTWISVIATKETDIETIETEHYASTYEEYERFAIDRDREDYRRVLADFGFSEETARRQSEDPETQMMLSMNGWKIKVDDSPIEGKGIFATGNIAKGELIYLALINGMRTQAGRYTNHSKTPNAIMVLRDNRDIDLVATSHIDEGEEITTDYQQTLLMLGIKPGIREDE